MSDSINSIKHIEYIKTKLVREDSSQYIAENKISDPQGCADVINKIFDLKDADKEYFVIAYLDTRNCINAVTLVSIGSLSEAIVHPGEVFKSAILYNASAIILCHNHPSGDPGFSTQDKVTTDRLVEASKILGINILDHITIGYQGIRSMKEEGLLKV